MADATMRCHMHRAVQSGSDIPCKSSLSRGGFGAETTPQKSLKFRMCMSIYFNNSVFYLFVYF